MTHSGQKPRILIIDDQPLEIRLLAESLKDRYEIILATDGQAGLKRALSVPAPDLILLDVVMRGLSGLDVCRRLTADPATRNIPVIFISSLSGDEDETQGLEAGAVDFINKPFRLPVVLARIRTHLELKRRGDVLESLSYLDGLTGIPNRRRFDNSLEIEWRRAGRTGRPVSLILADVDWFKRYNDAYGHIAGDACLKQVAQVLAGHARRPSDLVARLGGEEFGVLLPETDEEGARLLAEVMLLAVSDMAIDHEGSSLGRVTVSLGVATCVPWPGLSELQLLSVADQMLYAAKGGGRNRVMLSCVESADRAAEMP